MANHTELTEVFAQVANVSPETATGRLLGLLDPKQYKRLILEQSFSRDDRITSKQSFIIKDDLDQPPSEAVSRWIDAHATDSNLTIRLVKSHRVDGTDHPIAFIYSPEDQARLLRHPQTHTITGIIDTKDQNHLFEVKDRIDIFPTPKSLRSTMSGFDNYSPPTEVALGGGLRLFVESFHQEDGVPKLVLACTTVFNDANPRATNLQSHFEQSVPRYTSKLNLVITGKEFQFEERVEAPLSMVIDQGNIDLYTRRVLTQLLEQDRQPFRRLLAALLTQLPRLDRIHSFDAVFSVIEGEEKEPELVICFTDFDGIDNSLSWHFRATPFPPTPNEQFTAIKLAGAGLTPPDHFENLWVRRQRTAMSDYLNSLTENPNLPPAIAPSLSSHLMYWLTHETSLPRSLPVLLDRVLKPDRLSWQIVDPHTRLCSKYPLSLWQVDIAGLSLTYLLDKNGRLYPFLANYGVDEASPKQVLRLFPELSHICTTLMVPALLNLIRDGD